MTLFPRYKIHRTGKTLLTIAVVMHIMTGIVFSQENPSFIGIKGGLAIPFQKYAQTKLGKGSFTQPGPMLGAEGAWHFHPKFGVGASVDVSINPIDVASLGWEKVTNDPFLQDVTIRSESFVTLTAMAGGYTNLPLYKKFSFQGKILGGLLYGKTPYQLYKPEYFVVGPDYYEITSAKDWKFSWKAGAGIIYNVSDCVGLIWDTTIQFDELSFNFTSASGTRTEIHTIALINTSLGFRINL